MFDGINELKNSKELFTELARECSDYLAEGNYHVEIVFGKLALKKGRFNWRKLKNWYYQFILGTFHVESKTEINCTIALLPPFGNCKMFDQVSEITYTKLTDDYYSNIELFCNNMAMYIDTPILSLDKDHHILIEKFLKAKKIKDERQCFLYFYDSYMKYCKNICWNTTLGVKQVKKELKHLQVSIEMREYIDYLEDKLVEDTAEYPAILCHNDVHIKNILTENNVSFNLIDYELCGRNIFFSDVLGFIVNSAVFHKEYNTFELYRQGVFDSELEKLFNLFNMKYESEKKEYYVYLILYFRIYMLMNYRPEFPKSYIERSWKFEEYLYAE